jgi:hypothetical protein
VGNLKKTCPGKTKKQSTWKEEWSEIDPTPGFSNEKGENVLEGDSLINSMNSTTFIGKLKFISPALYLSLSSKELDWLQSIFLDFFVSLEPSISTSKSRLSNQRDFSLGELGEGLGLGFVHAKGFTLDEEGGGSLEGVTVVEGVLNTVELEASTAGGGFFFEDTLLEVGKKVSLES